MVKKERGEGDARPPSEREIELEARILAAEYLLKQCFWQMILQRAVQEADGDDDDVGDLATREAKQFRKLVIKDLRKASFPGLDPAWSDHVSDLVREHAERIVEELVQAMEDKRAQGLSSLGDF
jgi:ribulose 1,5-bisphosphate synthetase/thiazole synthase